MTQVYLIWTTIIFFGLFMYQSQIKSVDCKYPELNIALKVIYFASSIAGLIAVAISVVGQ